MSLRSNKLSQQLYLIVNMNSTAATPPPILSTTQAATSLSHANNTMMFPSYEVFIVQQHFNKLEEKKY